MVGFACSTGNVWGRHRLVGSNDGWLPLWLAPELLARCYGLVGHGVLSAGRYERCWRFHDLQNGKPSGRNDDLGYCYGAAPVCAHGHDRAYLRDGHDDGRDHQLKCSNANPRVGKTTIAQHQYGSGFQSGQ